MPTINDTVASYVAAFNETDPVRRRAAVAAAWTESGTFQDPHYEASGHDALDSLIAAIQDRLPGYRVRLISGIDAHHGCVRFSWAAGGMPDAPLYIGGTDYARIAPDGRFETVTGFYDALPSQA